ncbi:hypothetical protein PHLGIDRAFT_281394 [Phlebiopsis gigantea 11061_1 CR5-6]|uniref:DUF676 domain-containing protein n=1 Tax=Phlebiopsis gigantea (strain 11061_1 CR5-6) TaxID=745531 RepID=A0A0C3SDX3_PHLG1|nr:hypothetical protein PHLGIDRAFT_281394 [Phlebiopsis gigantea 11061_1 CR5-6]
MARSCASSSQSRMKSRAPTTVSIGEVLDEVKRILEEKDQQVTKLSVIGYSLGGLVSRYLVGVLHQRKFFDKVTPVNFVTVATPHIGLIQFPGFRSKMFAYLGPRLLSRTGKQFYAVDQWSASGRPLLEVMADPDRIFYQALSLFPHICFYANAVNDTTVPYLTAAVETEDPFDDYMATGLQVELDEEYSPIIKSYSLPEVRPDAVPGPRMFSPAWFSSVRVPLPPVFQANFPYNALIYLSLPILIPMLMSMAVLRLSLDSHKSQKRIRALENHDSYRERLVQIVGQMEKRVEDVVVDYIVDPAEAAPRAAEPSVAGHTPTTTTLTNAGSATAAIAQQGGAVSPLQRKLARWLNGLPQLEKQLAFVDLVFNSHAVIIARDVRRFKHHARGHGVLNHLADHLVL